MTALFETISGFILFVIEKIGYGGIFLLMVLQSSNIPIPSEITLPFSGFLAQRGVFNFWMVVAAGAFGSLIGSLISYKLADLLIRKGVAQKYGLLKILINEKSLKIAEEWFRKYGAFSIFFGRLIPIVSTFISFPAGLAKMRIGIFSALTFVGAFIWSTLLVWLGFLLGENWELISEYFRKFDILIFILIVSAIIFFIWKHLPKNNSLRANQ